MKAASHLVDANAAGGCKLEHMTIGSLSGLFFVPAYQRGYRWGRDDVRRLLDDIWESQGKDYSLQPIVVKEHEKREAEEEKVWELIDGQQRLTTLFLIFRYIKQQAWRKNEAPFSLRYDTRPGSERYLKNLGDNSTDDESLSKSNIDYFHLHQAYDEIARWFETHGDKDHLRENAAIKLSTSLFDTVRVIWYEAATSVDATELFARLNVGRIPLTDAELVKAALLSKIRIAESQDRAQEIAAHWDAIERDLHRKDIWAFVAGSSIVSNDEKFATRISLLLDTLADHKRPPPSEKRPLYFTFDTLRDEIEQNPIAFWSRLVSLHAQILGWFEQPELYNKIGFLSACSEESTSAFGQISKDARGKKKSEFNAYLTERVRDSLNIKADDLEALSYEDQKRGYNKLMQLLLLMNVETSSRTGCHFPFARHLGERWSLEHIHAQNAERLNKSEQWQAWLQAHMVALDAIRTPNNCQEVDQIKADILAALSCIGSAGTKAFSGSDFSDLSHQVLRFLNKDEAADHSISNMALLSHAHNSELNNAVFEVKRQRVMEMDRKGDYVPVCTRNVFLKYYANADAQQPHFWSDLDKVAYQDAIKALLSSYFKQDSQVPA